MTDVDQMMESTKCVRCGKSPSTRIWDVKNNAPGWNMGTYEIISGAIAWCCDCDHWARNDPCHGKPCAVSILEITKRLLTDSGKSDEEEDSLDWFRSKLR